MRKLYNILLDNLKIGTTDFEEADAPMGSVFGKIVFIDFDSGYQFFKNYCLENKLNFSEFPTDNLISTFNIPNLRVIGVDGSEIKGVSCYISGMDSDQFDIYVEGIEYPFYEIEFPHHVKFYKELKHS